MIALVKVAIVLSMASMILSASCLQDQIKTRSTQLHQLFDDYWEYVLESSPTFATYLGDHRYDDALEDVSQEAYDKETKSIQKFLDRLQEIDINSLPPEDKHNYQIFERILEDRIEEAKFQPFLTPISQQDGPHIEFPQLISYHPFTTVQDYQNYTKRLHAFKTMIDQTIANMRTGLEKKIVAACVTIEKTIPQIQTHIVSDVERSVLYQPVANLPKDLSEEERTQIITGVANAIQTSVVPAFKDLLEFVQNEYLPECRSDVGIWSLPDGKERYTFSARRYTTTSLTPEEIHTLGKKELARIQNEMRAIKDEVGFKGNLQAFIEHLRKDKSLYNNSAEELMTGFREILNKVDKRLPELFGRLPVAKYDLKVMESYREQAAPAAYYYPPPEDGSRPGYFYVNTYKPEERPKYTMESLAFHEAVPGHHIQIAIMQELDNLPSFRQHQGFTAFVEGWGLYSESLPKELGFYNDPYSDFGRLTYEAWRATRLVVDTGIHSFGWTREQAIKFFKENTGLSELNIISEVERYIAWPGQALAYKIGELKIKELRTKAQEELGDRFDIKAFHDKILGDGALPLDVLERQMNDWIIAMKESAR